MNPSLVKEIQTHNIFSSLLLSKKKILKIPRVCKDIIKIINNHNGGEVGV